MTSLTLEACKPTGAKPRDAERSKNFFALGLCRWIYQRPIARPTVAWIAQRYGAAPIVVEANTLAFRAGYHFGETAELFESAYEIAPAEHRARHLHERHGQHRPGLGAARRRATGEAPSLPRLLPDHAGLGHLARALQAQELRRAHPAGRRRDRRHRRRPRRRFRRALSGSRRRAARASTSSPRRSGSPSASSCRFSIVDIQRGGPSTGLPTKTEQSDLLHAMFGRHGEAPVPIVAAMTPSHCFDAAIEAVRIALKYRTPVYLLSDGYLANGRSPGSCPTSSPARTSRPPSPPSRTPSAAPTASRPSGPTSGIPRRWRGRGRSRARPASSTASAASRRRTGPATSPTTRSTTSAMVHAAGGQDRRHRQGHPAGRVRRPDGRRRRCSCSAGVRPMQPSWPACGGSARPVAAWPRPTSSTSIRSRRTSARSLTAYDGVLVPEGNLGQLARLVRADFLVDARSLSKMQGTPFRVGEIEQAINDAIDGLDQAAEVAATDERNGSEAPANERRRPTDDRRGRSRHDPQGLDERPGRALVPGMRGLLDPRRRAVAAARARRAPGEHRVRLRHRLCRPLPVLHEHLRHALDPRAGPGGGDRPRRHPARSRRLGGHRRRRRPLHRRQPPHPLPCAATSTSRSSCSTTRSTASRRASTRRPPRSAR